MTARFPVLSKELTQIMNKNGTFSPRWLLVLVDSTQGIINEGDAFVHFYMRRTKSNVSNDIFGQFPRFAGHYTVSNVKTTSQSSSYPHRSRFYFNKPTAVTSGPFRYPPMAATTQLMSGLSTSHNNISSFLPTPTVILHHTVAFVTTFW